MAKKVEIKCPYSDKCTDVESAKCLTCLNNEKRSYYRPDNGYYYWYPFYQPYYPYYEPWKITYTTSTTGDDLSMPVTSFYKSV